MSKKNPKATEPKTEAALPVDATMRAALKRNDRKGILVAAIPGLGDEMITEIRDSTRVTAALIDRAYASVESTAAAAAPAEKEVAKDPTDLTYADKKEPADDGFNDIRKAIKKGKGKKAMKLIKAARDNGSKGSVLKGLAKEAGDL